MAAFTVCAAIMALAGVQAGLAQDRESAMPSEQLSRDFIPFAADGRPTAMTFGFWNKAVNTSLCVRAAVPPVLYEGTWAKTPPPAIAPQGGVNHTMNPGFRALALATPIRGTYINGTMNFNYGHGHVSIAFAAVSRGFLSEVRWGGCSVRTQSYVIDGEIVYMFEADLHEEPTAPPSAHC